MTELFSSIIDWYILHINYLTITLLMAIESSFIPFPSEIVVPPAAWKAAQGQMSLAGVFLSSTAGAIIGALFNYYFALYLGRKVLYKLADTRIAHFLLIKKEGLEKAEVYFNKYGRSSTFIGRLVPGIRQLISLPAGLARMNLKHFLIYSFLGSGLWNIVLMLLGYFLYSQKELLEKQYHNISYFLLAIGVLFFTFLIAKGIFRRGKEKQLIKTASTAESTYAKKVKAEIEE